jgi:hypothetical protein
MSLEPSLEGVGDGVGELDDSARERGDFIAELEEEVSEWGVGRDKLSVREGRKAAGERALAALQEAEAGREAAKKIQADNDQLRRQLLELSSASPGFVSVQGFSPRLEGRSGLETSSSSSPKARPARTAPEQHQNSTRTAPSAAARLQAAEAAFAQQKRLLEAEAIKEAAESVEEEDPIQVQALKEKVERLEEQLEQLSTAKAIAETELVEVRKSKAELQALYDASLQGDIGLKAEGFYDQPLAQADPWPRSTRQQLLILQADRQDGFQNQQVELLSGGRGQPGDELAQLFPVVNRLGDKDYEAVELLLPAVQGFNDVLQHLRVGCGVPPAAPVYRLLEDSYNLVETWLSYLLRVGQARVYATERDKATGANRVALELSTKKTVGQIEQEFYTFKSRLRACTGLPQTEQEKREEEEREERLAKTFEEKLYKKQSEATIARLVAGQKRPFVKKTGSQAGPGDS